MLELAGPLRTWTWTLCWRGADLDVDVSVDAVAEFMVELATLELDVDVAAEKVDGFRVARESENKGIARGSDGVAPLHAYRSAAGDT